MARADSSPKRPGNDRRPRAPKAEWLLEGVRGFRARVEEFIEARKRLKILTVDLRLVSAIRPAEFRRANGELTEAHEQRDRITQAVLDDGDALILRLKRAKVEFHVVDEIVGRVTDIDGSDDDVDLSQVRKLLLQLTRLDSIEREAADVTHSDAGRAATAPRKVYLTADESSFKTATGTLREGGRIRVQASSDGRESVERFVSRGQWDALGRLVGSRRVDLGRDSRGRQLATRLITTLKDLDICARRPDGGRPGEVDLIDTVELRSAPLPPDTNHAFRRFNDETFGQRVRGEI